MDDDIRELIRQERRSERELGERVIVGAGHAAFTRGPAELSTRPTLPDPQPALTDHDGRPVPATVARLAAEDPVWAEMVYGQHSPHDRLTPSPNRAQRRAARRRQR